MYRRYFQNTHTNRSFSCARSQSQTLALTIFPTKPPFKTNTTKPLNRCHNVTRRKHAHEWVCKQIARCCTGASFYHRESTETTQWLRLKEHGDDQISCMWDQPAWMTAIQVEDGWMVVTSCSPVEHYLSHASPLWRRGGQNSEYKRHARTHARSGVDIWMGLKIDQVTVKFATAPRAKVNAPSVSAAVSSTEAEEQRVQQIHELTANDMLSSKSKPRVWAPLIYFNYFNLSPSLSYSLPNFSQLLYHYLIKKTEQKCHKIGYKFE